MSNDNQYRSRVMQSLHEGDTVRIRQGQDKEKTASVTVKRILRQRGTVSIQVEDPVTKAVFTISPFDVRLDTRLDTPRPVRNLLITYLTTPNDQQTITTRRQVIRDQFLPLIGNANNVQALTNEMLREMVFAYDRLFFDNQIRDFYAANRHEHLTVRFGKGTVTVGKCEVTGCTSTLKISKVAFSDLFNGTHEVETVNGLQCTTQLDCMMLTVEHEMIHLLLFKIQPTLDLVKKEKHSPRFQALARNLFGHTDFRHNLGRGLTEDPKQYRERVIRTIRTGNIVSVRDPKTQVVGQYEVLENTFKSNSKTFRARRVEDGSGWHMPLINVVLPDEKE